MKKLLERYRQWKWERDFTRAKKVLGLMLANKDPEIFKELATAANEVAKGMCMRWLDNQRITHCAHCPNTKPLLYLNGAYLCAGHAEQARASSALEVVGA